MKLKVEHKKNGSIEVTDRKILRNIIRDKVGNKGLKSVYHDTYGSKSNETKKRRKKKSGFFSKLKRQPKIVERIELIPLLESLYSRQNKRIKNGGKNAIKNVKRHTREK